MTQGYLVSFIGEIYFSKDFRDLLRTNPEGAMDKYNLNEAQRELVFSLDKPRIAAYVSNEIMNIDPWGEENQKAASQVPIHVMWPTPVRSLIGVEPAELAAAAGQELTILSTGLRLATTTYTLRAEDGTQSQTSEFKILDPDLDHEKVLAVFDLSKMAKGAKLTLLADDKATKPLSLSNVVTIV